MCWLWFELSLFLSCGNFWKQLYGQKCKDFDLILIPFVLFYRIFLFKEVCVEKGSFMFANPSFQVFMEILIDSLISVSLQEKISWQWSY